MILDKGVVMKPAIVGKVYFVRGGDLFPVSPIITNLPKGSFSNDRDKNSNKSKLRAATKKKKIK
mgnify:CR=1 FL=1